MRMNWIALALAVLAAAHGQGTETPEEVFAKIAATDVTPRLSAGMEVPGPAPVPSTVLPWNGGAAAAPLRRIETAEQLRAALATERARLQPFLRELAPPLPQVRTVIPVAQMNFRMETPEDRDDFGYTLAGRGPWQTVAIPHYTGPGEQAVCWYRSTFLVSAAMKRADRLLVHFGGVSYFADVFVNGHLVGSHQGYFAAFDCDFSPYARQGENVLLVRVRNSSRMGIGSSPTDDISNRPVNVPRTFGDKIESSNSPGWNDPTYGWNCTPNGFGIDQGVTIESRSGFYIGDIFARPDWERKEVEVTVEVENPGEGNFVAGVEVGVAGRNFAASADLERGRASAPRRSRSTYAGTRSLVRFTVPLGDARVWSPEAPWVYTAQVRLSDGSGKLIDTAQRSFGLRSFVMKTDSHPAGRMYLNGQEIRLRGTNEMGNFQLDVMRRDWDRLIDDLLLTKLTGLNYIRCTQTVMPPEFYDYCDRLGVMNQSDLPLFSKLSHKQVPEALRQTVEMARIVRSHPSDIMVSFINEPDNGDGTGGYAFAVNRAELEQFLAAARILVRLENPDQTIKLVDGDYNPPSDGFPDNHCYSGWYGEHGVSLDRLYAGYWMNVRTGWMFGCGEYGVEGLDSIATMEKYYPRSWLTLERDGGWKPNRILGSQTWDMHGPWFPTQRTMADWVRASQEHQADVIILKTEAFRRMPRMNSFAVHLLIDAWPNGWLKSLMDVDRQPKPAWFALHNALAPLAVQVRSEGQKRHFAPNEKAQVELWICNDTARPPPCGLVYQIEQDGKVVRTGSAPAEVPTVTQGAVCQGVVALGRTGGGEQKFTLRVSLKAKGGKVLDQYVFDYTD